MTWNTTYVSLGNDGPTKAHGAVHAIHSSIVIYVNVAAAHME